MSFSKTAQLSCPCGCHFLIFFGNEEVQTPSPKTFCPRCGNAGQKRDWVGPAFVKQPPLANGRAMTRERDD